MFIIYIIEKTLLELELPSLINHQKIIERMKISLQAINLKGIEINEEEITYDYSQQGNQLIELLQKQEEYEKDIWWYV